MLVPLCAFLQSSRGVPRGISFLDSSALLVCHNRRISSHRVFAGLAARGKTSVDWLKLHLVINDQGQWRLTPGNTDDRTPVPSLVKQLHGILVGGKGYLSRPLATLLAQQGLRLLTPIRRNMRQCLMTQDDVLLLRKRTRIESVFHSLKHSFLLFHSRHRSLPGFFATLLSALLAFSLS